MVSGGIFKKKSGFTAVQNEVARDPELSMKAKGLYLVINSYITMPDKTWGKSDFYSKVCEGTKAFDSAWDELKEKGYLKVRMYSDGRSWYTELELLDVKEKGAHTFYYNRAGDLTHTNLTKPKANNIQKDVDNSENLRTPQNGGNGKIRTPHFGSNGNGSNGDGSNGNGGNNNNTNNKTLNNTVCNPSIYRAESAQTQPTHVDNSDRQMDEPVILDLDEMVSVSEEQWIREGIIDNDGIPFEWCTNLERITQTIKCVTDWNSNISSKSYENFGMNLSAYKLFTESLIEMVTSSKVEQYGNSHVNYSHVVKQINVLLNAKEGLTYGYMPIFATQAVNRFVGKAKTEKIKNPKKYMKSLIWSLFSTSMNDWDGYMFRTYYGIAEE